MYDGGCDGLQGLLCKMVDAVMATYRTNFFMPNRWAISLRVDPRVLMTSEELQVRARLDSTSSSHVLVYTNRTAQTRPHHPQIIMRTTCICILAEILRSLIITIPGMHNLSVGHYLPGWDHI